MQFIHSAQSADMPLPSSIASHSTCNFLVGEGACMSDGVSVHSDTNLIDPSKIYFVQTMGVVLLVFVVWAFMLITSVVSMLFVLVLYRFISKKRFAHNVSDGHDE